MRFRWETAAVGLVTVLVIAIAGAEPLRNAFRGGSSGPHAAGEGLQVEDHLALDLADETLGLDPDELDLEQWEARLEALLGAVERYDPGDPAAFVLWYAVAYAADIVADDVTLDDAIDAMADLVAVDPGLIELVEEEAWRAALADYLPGELVVKNPRGAVVTLGAQRLDGVDGTLSVAATELPLAAAVDGTPCGRLEAGMRATLVAGETLTFHSGGDLVIECLEGGVRANPDHPEAEVVEPSVSISATRPVEKKPPVRAFAVPDKEELPPCRTETRMVSRMEGGAIGNVVGEVVVNEPCRPVE